MPYLPDTPDSPVQNMNDNENDENTNTAGCVFLHGENYYEYWVRIGDIAANILGLSYKYSM